MKVQATYPICRFPREKPRYRYMTGVCLFMLSMAYFYLGLWYLGIPGVLLGVVLSTYRSVLEIDLENKMYRHASNFKNWYAPAWKPLRSVKFICISKEQDYSPMYLSFWLNYISIIKLELVYHNNVRFFISAGKDPYQVRDQSFFLAKHLDVDVWDMMNPPGRWLDKPET